LAGVELITVMRHGAAGKVHVRGSPMFRQTSRQSLLIAGRGDS
jgi:hypothetical protein